MAAIRVCVSGSLSLSSSSFVREGSVSRISKLRISDYRGTSPIVRGVASARATLHEARCARICVEYFCPRSQLSSGKHLIASALRPLSLETPPVAFVCVVRCRTFQIPAGVYVKHADCRRFPTTNGCVSACALTSPPLLRGDCWQRVVDSRPPTYVHTTRHLSDRRPAEPLCGFLKVAGSSLTASSTGHPPSLLPEAAPIRELALLPIIAQLRVRSRKFGLLDRDRSVGLWFVALFIKAALRLAGTRETTNHFWKRSKR